jgi:hypothetical protein
MSTNDVGTELAMDDFYDPRRNLRSAVARLNLAVKALDEGAVYPEVIELLEKAHYRIERAQESVALDFLEEYDATNEAEAWQHIADAVGSSPRQARKRFRRASEHHGGGS